MANFIKKYQIYNQVTSQNEYAETWEEALTLQKRIIAEFLQHTGACQISIMYHNDDESVVRQCVPDENGDAPLKIIESIKWEKINLNESLITVKTLHPHNYNTGESVFIENQQDNYDIYSAVYGTTSINEIKDQNTFTCILNQIEPTFSNINININSDMNITCAVSGRKSYQFTL